METTKLTTAQKTLLRQRSTEEGARLARKVFAKRGNHSEAHLTEVELAASLAVAFEFGYEEGVPQPSLCPSCGSLTNVVPT
jgi:hypothetical protein